MSKKRRCTLIYKRKLMGFTSRSAFMLIPLLWEGCVASNRTTTAHTAMPPEQQTRQKEHNQGTASIIFSLGSRTSAKTKRNSCASKCSARPRSETEDLCVPVVRTYEILLRSKKNSSYFFKYYLHIEEAQAKRKRRHLQS